MYNFLLLPTNERYRNRPDLYRRNSKSRRGNVDSIFVNDRHPPSLTFPFRIANKLRLNNRLLDSTTCRPDTIRRTGLAIRKVFAADPLPLTTSISACCCCYYRNSEDPLLLLPPQNDRYDDDDSQRYCYRQRHRHQHHHHHPVRMVPLVLFLLCCAPPCRLNSCD